MADFNSLDLDKQLQAVSRLVEQGHGKVIISRLLGISEGKSTRLIKRVKEQAGEAPEPVHEKDTSGKFSEDKLPEIRDLMDQGHKSPYIAEWFNVSERTARYWMQKAKLNHTRTTIIDKVVTMLDEGSDTYDIAKKFNRSIAGVNSMIKKAECQFSPVDDWVKRAGKSGIKLSKLKEVLKIKNKEKAVKVLEDNFPGCFIVETPIEDGDVLLVPISNSDNFLNRLSVDTSKRRFKVGIVSHNYIIIKVDDDFGEDKLTIYSLGDIHCGAKAFRKEAFQSVINIIKDDPGALWINMGDEIEAANKQSVADPMEQYCGMNEQVVEYLELVNPITDKILVSVWSNHPGRVERFADFDLCRTIAELLKTPYCRERTVIEIHWRGTIKRVSVTHKYGHAHTPQAIEAAIDKIRTWQTPGCQAYYSGHVHNFRSFPKNEEVLVPGKGFVSQRYFVCTGGSFLGRNGTYASREGYGPTPQDTVYYGFYENGKDFSGGIELDCD